MSRSTPTVFVIDDDVEVHMSIQGLLKSAGLSSEAFGTAEEFLGNKVLDGPSCLVLDVSLPGVDGLELQRKLADGGVLIPIIFITGHGDIPMTVRAFKSGAVEFLTKPFVDQDLLNAIQQAFDRAHVSRMTTIAEQSSDGPTGNLVLIVSSLRQHSPAFAPNRCYLWKKTEWHQSCYVVRGQLHRALHNWHRRVRRLSFPQEKFITNRYAALGLEGTHHDLLLHFKRA